MTNGLNWTISYTDYFGKKTVELFKDRDAAQARYESLVPRTYGDFGDLINVTAPVRSAAKVSEAVLATADLSNEWEDLEAIVKALLIRGSDNPHGNYFYVKSDYRDYADGVHSVYSNGTDSHILDIHVVGPMGVEDGELYVAVVNQGLQDKPFDNAYGVVKPVAQDMFGLADIHGTVVKIDDPSEYDGWKKSLGFKNEDGASAASLGVAPMGVVKLKNN